MAPDARTVMTGLEGSTIEVMRADVDRYFGAFSDVTTEIVDMLSDGDRLVMWWRTTGTHIGPYGDIAPQTTGPITLAPAPYSAATVTTGRSVPPGPFAALTPTSLPLPRTR